MRNWFLECDRKESLGILPSLLHKPIRCFRHLSCKLAKKIYLERTCFAKFSESIRRDIIQVLYEFHTHCEECDLRRKRDIIKLITTKQVHFRNPNDCLIKLENGIQYLTLTFKMFTAISITQEQVPMSQKQPLHFSYLRIQFQFLGLSMPDYLVCLLDKITVLDFCKNKQYSGSAQNLSVT